MLRRAILLAALVLLASCGGSQGSGKKADSSEFKPSTQPGVLDWSKFPEFRLAQNLIAVWQGPYLGSAAGEPLKHGFTHIASRGIAAVGKLSQPVESRAILWTGIAYEEGQPWAELNSPWGNDMEVYTKRWERYWRAYADDYSDSIGMLLPNVDIICADIEAHLQEPKDILKLRHAPSTPPSIARLDDRAFVDRYRRDMARLYEVPLKALREAGFKGKITSYTDVPVMRNWSDIEKRSWAEWSSDRSLVNTILADPDIPGSSWIEAFGPFYNLLDILSPSAYFFYPYPGDPERHPVKWNRASLWLSYLLFQVEANRAWSDKDQILFLWMDFHTNRTRIRPHMAHGAAVFPFLAGAKGIWLWAKEDFDNSGSPKESYAVYEWFVYGLYRLSKFNAFFEGQHSFWAPDNPVALQKGSKPVVRGVVKGKQLLVGVQNPFAADLEKTEVDIVYKGQSLGVVELTGPNLWLGVFDIRDG